jgi:hypothetical protein
MTDRLKSMLATAAQRLPNSRGRSVAAQIRALASALALATAVLATVGIQHWLGSWAYTTLPIVLSVLRSCFCLLATMAIARRARDSNLRPDAVSLDDQIEAAFDAELDRIERLGVAEPIKQGLRLEAYRCQQESRFELRGSDWATNIATHFTRPRVQAKPHMRRPVEFVP